MLEEFKSQGVSVRQFAVDCGFAVSTSQQVIAGTYPKMDSLLAQEILATADGYLHPEKHGELEKPVVVPVFVHELTNQVEIESWGFCPMCGRPIDTCWCGFDQRVTETY